MEAIKILLGFENLLTDCFLSYDSIRQQFKRIEISKSENCPICKASIIR